MTEGLISKLHSEEVKNSEEEEEKQKSSNFVNN